MVGERPRKPSCGAEPQGFDSSAFLRLAAGRAEPQRVGRELLPLPRRIGHRHGVAPVDAPKLWGEVPTIRRNNSRTSAAATDRRSSPDRGHQHDHLRGGPVARIRCRRARCKNRAARPHFAPPFPSAISADVGPPFTVLVGSPLKQNRESVRRLEAGQIQNAKRGPIQNIEFTTRPSRITARAN